MKYEGSVPLEEALMDYKVIDAPKEYADEIEVILPSLRRLVERLDIHLPYVAFIKPARSRTAAFYISGTMDYPVIVIVANAVKKLLRKSEPRHRREELYFALKGNIVHELAHAYLESCGADTHDHDEDVIENATRDFLDFHDAAEFKKSLDEHLKDIEPEGV